MIKELLKYMLPLCILLVDGISNMYAGSQEGPICKAPVQLLAESQHPHFIQAFDDNEPAFRLPDHARRFSELIKAISEEKEEDSTESVSLKKQPRSSGVLPPLLSLRRAFSWHPAARPGAIRPSAAYAISHRYLLLRVLRI